MAPRRWPTWRVLWPGPGWMLLLAIVPWWLGLPSLLALAVVVGLLQHRLTERHAQLIRRALRWGLAGMLFSLQRRLGGDVMAWGAALLGALAGYTLLAGLEAWLDRELRRAPPADSPAEWPQRMPDGPPAQIIELDAVHWQSANHPVCDPLGGPLRCSLGVCHFATGERIDELGEMLAFSPSGRWFVASARDRRRLFLWDRQRERRHRLRGWQLAGWHRDQPWLNRRDDAAPLCLAEALGEQDTEN